MKYLPLLVITYLVFGSYACSNCDKTCNPNATLSLDHIALKCKDVNASALWYKDIFETPEITNQTLNPAITWLSLGNTELHLTPFRDTLPLVHHKSHHMAIGLRDLAPLITKLKERNIPYEGWSGKSEEITTRPDGIHQIYFRDPDGYWIEANDAMGAR